MKARSSSLPDAAEQHRRRLEAMHLQALEGNPLSDEDVEMFEMFEREGWSSDRRRAHMMAKALSLAAE